MSSPDPIGPVQITARELVDAVGRLVDLVADQEARLRRLADVVDELARRPLTIGGDQAPELTT